MDAVPQPPSAFDFRHIRYEKQPPVARVLINRPEVLNSLNFTTLREMSRAFEDASWDDGIAVLILTGSGDRASCTGAALDAQDAFMRRPRDYCTGTGPFMRCQE